MDGGLLVDAEHDRVDRRLQVEAQHRGGLVLKLRIIARHVVTAPVRLQPGFAPDARHPHVVNVQGCPQFTTTPLRRAIRRLAMQRPIDNSGSELLGSSLGHATAMPTPQARQALCLETPAPQANGIKAATLLPADGRQTPPARSQRQDDFRTPRILDSRAATPAHAMKFTSFRRAQDDAFGHGADLNIQYSELNVTLH